MASPPKIPKTMRSLAAPKYGKPAIYEVIELPVPTIKEPNEVLLKVHACTISTGDTQFAGGTFWPLVRRSPPHQIGVEGSGVVVAVGSAVTSCKVGDAVYGLAFTHPFFPLKVPGFCSEYTVVRASVLLHKPPTVTFEEAAALVGSTITAYQSIRLALALMGDGSTSLAGKTVFMPAALSATGSVGAQVIKNEFGAKKLIATVSTPKMGLVEGHLPGIVDQLIDYKTQDVVKEVGRGTVDVVYNTQWDMTGTFPLLKPKTGVIASIASVPPPSVIRSIAGELAPTVLLWVVALVQMWYDWKLRGTNVKHGFVSGNPGNLEDFAKIGEMIAEGKIKPVIDVVELDNLSEIRRKIGHVATGKGGLGKVVVKIV